MYISYIIYHFISARILAECCNIPEETVTQISDREPKQALPMYIGELSQIYYKPKQVLSMYIGELSQIYYKPKQALPMYIGELTP